MATEPGVRIRPVAEEDRFLIRRWLSDPEVRRWWGGTAAAEAAITLALESLHALPRVVECDSRPIGYVHAIDVAILGEEQAGQLPPGIWQIDFFTGVAEHRGQNGEATALALLAAEVFSTTLAVACCGIVSVRNEAGVRAYEKAGFRWLRIWTDRVLGPCWLMEKAR
jgi:RimJ/RimL family protein N-acetyltransferase